MTAPAAPSARPEPAARGTLTQVCVDRASRRPVAALPAALRAERRALDPTDAGGGGDRFAPLRAGVSPRPSAARPAGAAAGGGRACAVGHQHAAVEVYVLQGRARDALCEPVCAAHDAIRADPALAETLRQRRLAAAGLDVFKGEPQVHPGLLEAPNVVLTPPIASATLPTRRAMADLAADNLIAFLTRGQALTLVHHPPRRRG